MFTVDASVWVNADSPAEPGQPAGRALLDSLIASGTTIVVPTLLAVEVAGAISRTRGDSKLASEMATALLGLPLLRWVALDELLAQQAADFAAFHRLRGADALCAAVALSAGCELISLDQEHLTRLKNVVTTLTPADALQRIKDAD